MPVNLPDVDTHAREPQSLTRNTDESNHSGKNTEEASPLFRRVGRTPEAATVALPPLSRTYPSHDFAEKGISKFASSTKTVVEITNDRKHMIDSPKKFRANSAEDGPTSLDASSVGTSSTIVRTRAIVAEQGERDERPHRRKRNDFGDVFNMWDQSVAQDNRVVERQMRSDVVTLQTRTHDIQRDLQDARIVRRIADRRVASDVRFSRNALPPRFLRLHGRRFFLERLAETLERVVRGHWFVRWKRVNRAMILREREERRRFLLLERKRNAAILLAKHMTYHFSFWMRWAKRRRFIRWHKRMMHIRRLVMAVSATKIQSLVRGHLARRHHRRMVLAAIEIQRFARGKIARKRVHIYRSACRLQKFFRQFLRRTLAAKLLQAFYRMWSVRRGYAYARLASTRIQGWYRGICWRNRVLRSSLALQTWWRSQMDARSIMIRRIQKTARRWLVYSKYSKGKWSVIKIQSYVRMQFRRRWYKKTIRRRREELARKRMLLADRRREKKMRFLFREARKICGNLYIVTVQRQPHDTVLLQAYSPARQRTFSFDVKKSSIRIVSRDKLLADAAAGRRNSPRSIVDDDLMYSQLADRLTERRVAGEISLKLKPRGSLGERGKLLLRRGVFLDGAVHIVSAYLYVGSYIFDAYRPGTQQIIRLRFSSHHLHAWLDWDPAESRRPYLLRPENQIELLEWLCKRLLIKFDPLLSKNRLLLEMQLHEDRKATIIQCMIRKRLARNAARRQCHLVIRKIFDAERGEFFYLYKRTGYKIWHKPRILLAEDIAVPDDWEEVSKDGEKLFFHPKTGRYSRISPVVAAIMVQKRFRYSRSKDYRMDLPKLVKAMKMINKATSEYKSRPNHLPALVNFALYLQCIKFDYLRARRVYERAREISARNPIVLYAYALLLLAGNFYPRKKYWMMAQDLLAIAKTMDTKRNAFRVAEESFFHWGIVVKPRDERALCNYALLQQYVNENGREAEKFFRRAVNLAPDNAVILKCYEEFKDPESVITPSERVLWKSRTTRDYMFDAFDTRGKQMVQNKSDAIDLRKHLESCGAAAWIDAMQKDLDIHSIDDLKQSSEGALIAIGMRPKIVREVFSSIGVDVVAKEKEKTERDEKTRRADAVRLIQSVFRRREARRKLLDLARQVIFKCWDENSGAFYYYNSMSGESKWSKPSLLGSADLEPYQEEEEASEGTAKSTTAHLDVDDTDGIASKTL